jgi:hypothetical protein
MDKPELPSDVEWPEATVKWFEAWRKSPRTDGWDEVQWQYMFDTALVHASIWGSDLTLGLPELRMRLAYLGLSFDPPKIAIQIVDSKKVTPLDEIRKRRERRGTPARRSGASS